LNALDSQTTDEELSLIRDWIMLPYMLTMADKKMQETQQQTQLFKRLFARGIRLVMDEITHDISDLRKELSRRQIKVWEDVKQGDILYHKYRCRGYEGQLSIMRAVLRSEISDRYGQYIDQVFQNSKLHQ
jgi:DNA-directed RNA polymerase beta' subunit